MKIYEVRELHQLGHSVEARDILLGSSVGIHDFEASCLLFDIFVELKDVVRAEKWLQVINQKDFENLREKFVRDLRLLILKERKDDIAKSLKDYQHDANYTAEESFIIAKAFSFIGEKDQAHELLRYIQNFPANSQDEDFIHGLAGLILGSKQETIETFEALHINGYQNIKLWLVLSDLYFSNKNYGKCREVLEIIIKHHPGNGEYRIKKARAALRLGDIAATTDELEAFLLQNPENIQVIECLAECYMAANNFQKAGNRLRHVWNNDGLSFKALENYFVCLLKQENTNEALDIAIYALNSPFNHDERHKLLMDCFSLQIAYDPSRHPLLKVNDYIADEVIDFISEEIDSSRLSKFLRNCEHYLNGVSLKTNHSQIYLGPKSNLNCTRQKHIFFNYHFLADRCLSCFKVQLDCYNFHDFLKLLSVFATFEPILSLHRKLMVETRENVPGVYKGIIYVPDIEGAKILRNSLETSLFSSAYKIKVKRGCSEFYEKFPWYESIEAFTADNKFIIEGWAKQENDLESSALPSQINAFIKSSDFLGRSVNDYLVIKKWIEFAKTHKDPFALQF